MKNLLAIPAMNLASGILLFFFNVQIVFLLRSPDYFNVPSNEIGQISNDIVFYSVILQMVFVILIGYVYDILGRKITLTTSIAL
jgi:hypothetical protein